MADNKVRYAAFCGKAYVPLQFQPWWLDAVCGVNGWNVALATDNSGEITGVLPYWLHRRWGLKIIQLPPWTTYAGPWLNYPQTLDFKVVSRLAFEKRVMTDLIRQLPAFVFFKQNFRPEIKNWLPFYWKGFRQTTRYTYIFDAINDLEKITEGFKNTLRSDLKKAEKLVQIRREDDSWEMVLELNKQSFQRKKLHPPNYAAQFKKLHMDLNHRKQSACFIAYDLVSGRPSAGLYLIFDTQQAAILLTGTEPAFKNQCAIYILILEALVFSAKHHLSLDFEGSMDEQIEHAFRAFGAELTPYFQVSKMKLTWPPYLILLLTASQLTTFHQALI